MAPDQRGSSQTWLNVALAQKLAFSASSAVVAETSTYPIDIVKTRLQLQGEVGSLKGGANARGAFGTAAGILRDEGLQGLYRGLSPAVGRHIFYSSIRIGAYENLRGFFIEPGQDASSVGVGTKMLLGATAGVIGQVVASPMDLVKVRMQADGRRVILGEPPRYRGLTHALTTIVRKDGVSGLWRGVGPNAQRAALVNCGELAAYDQAKTLALGYGLKDGLAAHTAASVLSGLSATLFSCPADVVKTRMMNQERQGTVNLYRNSLDCLVKTVKNEGLLALWKGFFPTWARLGPWQFVFWVSYEQLRKAAGLSTF